jgi:hypothetical protein
MLNQASVQSNVESLLGLLGISKLLISMEAYVHLERIYTTVVRAEDND